ncbi:hypothetical protein CPA40_05385 [Bifidobacterium callitrichos]|uniref:CTP synthase n=1 Tax=Bifidobacterium callitrichos TaxID=762209 RepID=A0A2T3GAN5_9BIFI|nr:hypothetical protein [Bifidobacterium callitrichos]PST46555.1 hypothetical protein CPA40_05385 [Bifidobacterium callitrichos]
MKEHKGVTALLRTAEQERRCAIGESRSLYHALRRRAEALELVNPYPNLYSDAGYWRGLNSEQQSMHVIRALSRMHPKWVFAGLSAACVYGYQHAYSLHDGSVYIAGTCGASVRDCAQLKRIYMNRVPVWCSGSILMTSPARTLIDCAVFPFPNALAIYDSALRAGHVTIEEVRTLSIRSNCDESAVRRLLDHANPLSENGGESLTRGNIEELGFAAPELQIEFENPDNPTMPYRVDFCWRLADGRVIVAEFDGMTKYADTTNPNRASLQAKLDYERTRERHLKDQGVTVIIHLFYEDVMSPERLSAKLTTGGVPRIHSHRDGR